MNSTLNGEITANKARIKTLKYLLKAILNHRTVNLAILATTPDGRGCSNESRYRRLQDFFLNSKINPKELYQCILSQIPKQKGGYILAIDRTNWEKGKEHINLLTVSIIVGKVSIPIACHKLPAKRKKGNSCYSDRVKILEEILEIIPAKEIKALTMDREFDGNKWLQWLDEKGVCFVLRVKKNVRVGDKSADEFAKQPKKKADEKQEVFGMDLYVSSKKLNKKGEDTHLVVVSNRIQGKEATRTYKKRWGIERFFGHLKLQGFNLESTHMTAPKKINLLFAIVSLAFVLSFCWGIYLRKNGIATSKASQRKSFFRLGLEDILTMIQTHTSIDKLLQNYKIFCQWFNSNLWISDLEEDIKTC